MLTRQLLYTNGGRETVKTLGGRSYFTLPIMTRHRRPNGAVTRVENDVRGRPVKITDPEGGVLSYTYGPFGALL